jgi:hypothetical protein
VTWPSAWAALPLGLLQALRLPLAAHQRLLCASPSVMFGMRLCRHEGYALDKDQAVVKGKPSVRTLPGLACDLLEEASASTGTRGSNVALACQVGTLAVVLCIYLIAATCFCVTCMVGSQVRVSIAGPEPGYVATPIFAVEAAAELLEGREPIAQRAGSGGVCTPGQVLLLQPDRYISRLRHAGIAVTEEKLRQSA